uniref:Uncharacterized protein n=1 Tax=Romanomermis culicivorax TaxID=13658 RepID=A0A915HUE5_ROMCU
MNDHGRFGGASRRSQVSSYPTPEIQQSRHVGMAIQLAFNSQTIRQKSTHPSFVFVDCATTYALD